MKSINNNFSSLVAAVYLTVSAMGLFLLQPLYIGAAADTYDLGAKELGVMSTLFAIGAALGSIALMATVSRFNWRYLGSIALAILLSSIFIAFLANDYRIFMAAQGIAAIGSGATYSLALACMGNRENTDRAFGISIAAQVSFQVIGMSNLPAWIELYGVDSILLLFLFMNCLGLLAIFFLPEKGQASGLGSATPKDNQLTLPAFLALLGCFFFFANVGVFWTYIERIATLIGLSGQEIGNGLATGAIAGIIAALGAAWISDRFGRTLPLALGAALSLVALWFLVQHFNFFIFAGAMVLYQLGWNFSLTYQYSGVSAVDKSERAIAVAPAFHGAGAAAGPALAALFVTNTDLSPVIAIATICVVLSLASFVFAFRLKTH